MGQKVDPNILRIGITRSWDSKWYANKRDYSKFLLKDLKIEKIIREKLEDASVSRIEIHRTSNKVIINIHSAKPGLIIGRQGAGIEALKEELEKKFHEEFSLSIKEISKPAIDAKLLGENIAKQIEKRISYRRAAKMAVEKALESGAQGAKISLAGRLNGVEIARSEFFSKGKIPLHTLRANIDYAKTVAKTTYGTIGIKVWVYKGDVFKKKNEVQVTEMDQ
ncbi:MAG: 30S ribosomal protein S3 [Candidatus Gracilibacteria bacterium]|nr:30S ribosomal protein S3 [Candidatus Peregrinibacteria bacterium]